MKQKEFLKEVVDLAFSYLEQNPSQPNTSEFVGFLTQKLDKQSNESSKSEGDINSETDDLGIRLVLLNRYAKEYVKIALENTDLQTADEFPFLIALFSGGSHTKSELINKMLLTKTSGTEVLKRLLRKELIVEYDDLEDKRSKRVDISDNGRKLVLNLLPRMANVSKLISGNLSHAELNTTNYLLKKLSHHHRTFFENTTREEIKQSINPHE